MIAISVAVRQEPVLRIGLWSLLIAFLPLSSAFACGGIFDVACNLQHGGLSPENLGKQGGIVIEQGKRAGQDAVQLVANAINELQANVLSGPALEQAIIASRNTAIIGSTPIPPHIRQQLKGYASEDSMNRVRYKVGDNGFVNLAHLLEQGGLAKAVTLIDVIVFLGPSEADDPSLWAHELTHVDQYRAGAHSFAVQYARNWQSIENPAYEKGDGYLTWAQQNQTALPVQAQWPQQGQSGFPSNFGMVVCGCYGNGPVVAPEPRCASGAVRANLCPGLCPLGGSPYAYVCQ